MRAYQFDAFGLERLRCVDVAAPTPRANEIVVDVHAISLNYRDLLVIQGIYNPKLKLPATPISDGAGVVTAVGADVRDVRVGDHVVTHFVAGWQDGPYRGEYLPTTLGCPGPGMATEQVALPASAVLPIPEGYTFAEAATLPIAALTAWSALTTTGLFSESGAPVASDRAAHPCVLTLGTGGVSIFALQIAAALGARVFITSSSDEKLERAQKLGAVGGVNYRTNPDWEKRVAELTDGGADLTIDTVGAGGFDKTLRATRPSGAVALLGALAGIQADVNLGLIFMRRLRLFGVMVDSRAAFRSMNTFLVEKRIRPVIDRHFSFDELPQAIEHMRSGAHFGKIVVERN